KYSESWKEASTYFQVAKSEKDWISFLEAYRQPFGKLVKRELVYERETVTLPGAPDGQYSVMTLHSKFEHKNNAVETITFMLERDGKWKAAGYFIR
ncbi:MAG: DUF4019 domain-containing protein, partial [Chlorobium sp.]